MSEIDVLETLHRQWERRSFDYYQERAWQKANMELSPEMKLATFGLGIAGEAGEVADLIKKHLGHGHPLDKEKLTKELGDVLWYVAAIAKLADVDLQWVADENLAKLQKRYKEGFTPEESLNRKAE